MPQVDFEQIMQGRGSNNPLYSLFSGTHDIHAVAQASGANGIGSIHVQSIELDGVTMPQLRCNSSSSTTSRPSTPTSASPAPSSCRCESIAPRSRPARSGLAQR